MSGFWQACTKGFRVGHRGGSLKVSSPCAQRWYHMDPVDLDKMLSILTIVSPFFVFSFVFVFFLNCVKQTRPEIAFLTLTDIHCLCLWASDNCGWRLIFSGWLTVCMSHSCQSDISGMPRGILLRVWWLKVKVTVLIPGHHILKFCHMPQTWKSSWLTGRAFSDVQRAFWRLCWIHLEVYSLTFIHRLSRCPRSLCTFTYNSQFHHVQDFMITGWKNFSWAQWFSEAALTAL